MGRTDVSVEAQSPECNVWARGVGAAEEAEELQLGIAAGREDVGMTGGVVLINVRPSEKGGGGWSVE